DPKGLSRCPIWSPDGRSLASCGPGRVLHVWEATTGRERFTKPYRAYRFPVAFSPDSRHLAGPPDGKTIQVWDALTGADVLPLRGHDRGCNTLCFSPDGRHIASGSAFTEDKVQVWDARTGQPLATGWGHTNEVNALCFSPNGRWLASGSRDQTVRIWDA